MGRRIIRVINNAPHSRRRRRRRLLPLRRGRGKSGECTRARRLISPFERRRERFAPSVARVHISRSRSRRRRLADQYCPVHCCGVSRARPNRRRHRHKKIRQSAVVNASVFFSPVFSVFFCPFASAQHRLRVADTARMTRNVYDHFCRGTAAASIASIAPLVS